MRSPRRSPRTTGWSVVSTNELQHLRVLIANERRDRRDVLAEMVAGLGHEAVERSVQVTDMRAVAASVRPDVALVGVGSSPEQALELISEIVHEASCPVIALLPASDPAYLRRHPLPRRRSRSHRRLRRPRAPSRA